MPQHAFDRARYNMVAGQIRPIGVTNTSLLAVFANTPRHLFVPEPFHAIAYMDKEIPLQGRRFMLRPSVLAKLIGCAGIQPSDHILDIGCTTGYSSAILAHLGKKVFALEEERENCSRANYVLHHLGIENVIILGSLLKDGNPEGAPYDVILVNGAVDQVPESWFEQLNPTGGRLAVILRCHQSQGPCKLVCYTREGDAITSTLQGEVCASFLA
jgi:protein-L-isoaspartate(D-aspartate) O-methyltransferase